MTPDMPSEMPLNDPPASLPFLAGIRSAIGFIAIAIAAASLTGCSANFSETSPSSEPVSLGQIKGIVHGGQQPVTGASIQLYAASTSGYSAASSTLGAPVTSGANGSFTLGAYTCPSSSTQVYIVATGGNPGLTSGTNNPQLAMMAALGSCGNLSSSTYITLNEATTVAAVWALAPFMADATHVGTSSTNVLGLQNAFASALQLVNPTSGTAPGSTLPTGAVSPVPQVNTLADILAACVNTAGGSSGDGTNCGKLMQYTTPSGGSVPTNTIAAALSMSRYAGTNISNLYALKTSSSPFQPSLSSAPYDFTLSIGFTGTSGPGQLSLDSSSNVFVLDGDSAINSSFSATLWAFNNQGYAIQSAITLVDAATMDFAPDGSLWVNKSGGDADNGSGEVLTDPCILRISETGTTLQSINCFTSTGANNAYPFVTYMTVASPTGAVWLPSGYLGAFGSDGTNLSGGTGLQYGLQGGGYTRGRGIVSTALDTAGDAWVLFNNSSGVATLSEFSASGAALTASTGITGGGMTDAQAIAIDRNGNIWVASNQSQATAYHSVLSEFSPSGAPVIAGGTPTGGADFNIGRMMIDGDNTFWVQNIGNGISHYTGTGQALSSGAAGVGYLLTYQTSTSTTETDAVDSDSGRSVIDNAGNIWDIAVPVGGSNYLIYKMVGVAAPVVTPLSLAAKNSQLGTRP